MFRIRSDLNWADHENYTPRKAWKTLHFIMHILKKGNNNMKCLAYTALVRPILEHGAVCWDPYRGQESALNQLQKRVAKFPININEFGWETLAQFRLIARICTLVKAHIGRWAWNTTRNRLLKPCYLSTDNPNRKIKTRK